MLAPVHATSFHGFEDGYINDIGNGHCTKTKIAKQLNNLEVVLLQR